MAFVNFATREITAKIVYYGPGLGGKTTSLQYIHNGLPSDNRGKMISLATEEDRTIYFDFLPLHLGKIQEFSVRVQLYTVPGQVRYNATRKLVLRGADGVVFVADSQRHKKVSNLESFNNMEENLREHSKDLREVPHILQFNKVDLPNRMSAEELNSLLNKYNVPNFESCATRGNGVLEALKSITKLVFHDLGKKALLQKKTKTTPASISGERMVITQPEPVTASAAISGVLRATSSGEVMRSQETNVFPETSYGDLEVPAQNQPDPISTVEPSDDPFQVRSDEPERSGEFGQANAEVTYEDYSDYRTEVEQTTNDFFSFQSLYDSNPEFKPLIERMEKQIREGDTSGVVVTARATYSLLTKNLFPREYAVDSSESAIILALNIKYKRFVRFKNLLDSENLREPDLLFLHHFLCDLYLSIKEL